MFNICTIIQSITKPNMQIIKATLINPVDKESIEFIEHAGIATSEDQILDYGDFTDISKQYPNIEVLDYSDLVVTPGFIDLHTHIPQYPAIGKGKGELLPWLNNNIFPLEQKFSDYNYAFKLSEAFFMKAISFGTTTLTAFSSLHNSGTKAAIDAGLKSGVNLYIGNTLMDLGEGSYKHSIDQNIEDSLDLISYIQNSKNHSVKYILTPRYAGSCSVDLLKEVSKLAKEYDLHIQTHLSENLSELEFIASLHPNYKSYTDIYLETGILGSKTLLAHCIYLSDTELSILKQTGSNVIHCASSNRYLMSGRMNFAKYDEMNLKIGIGTDVAAGYSLSMANEMREALETSGDLYYTKKSDQLISHQRIFFSSTLEAAEILNNNRIGQIAKGKQVDLVFHKVYDLNDTDSILNQIIYGNSNVQKVIINGIERFSL